MSLPGQSPPQLPPFFTQIAHKPSPRCSKGVVAESRLAEAASRGKSLHASAWPTCATASQPGLSSQRLVTECELEGEPCLGTHGHHMKGIWHHHSHGPRDKTFMTFLPSCHRSSEAPWLWRARGSRRQSRATKRGRLQSSCSTRGSLEACVFEVGVVLFWGVVVLWKRSWSGGKLTCQ